jgi:hypothetical protein
MQDRVAPPPSQVCLRAQVEAEKEQRVSARMRSGFRLSLNTEWGHARDHPKGRCPFLRTAALEKNLIVKLKVTRKEMRSG